MADAYKIMYIGLQMVPSSDRPNNRPDRVWHGPGDVLGGIPPIQAAALLAHKDEWADVTHLVGAELLREQQAARSHTEERLRVLKNPVDAPNNKRGVAAATDDELEAELERRRVERVKIAGRSQQVATSISQQRPAPAVNTPDKSREAIIAAVERVMTRIGEKPDLSAELLSEEGVPTFVAVQEEVGYPIHEVEYRVALGLEEAEASAT